LWVAPPADLGANGDVNDLHQRDGLEAVAALLEAPCEPTQEGAEAGDDGPKPARFRVLTADDLAALPPVRWRVRGILPEQGLAAVYGPSGSGKSFLVLDMLGAVADGRAWFGHRVAPCPVTYLALEGEAGIAQRVNAYRVRHGRAPAEMRFVAGPFALLDDDDVRELAAAIRAAGGADGIVAVDTLNRSATGADENDSRDMGRLIEGAKRLQAVLGGLVLLVHHAGKDASRGLRGHSSLHAALDAVVEVWRDGDRREWRSAKTKDDRDGDSHPFRLAVVELGEDADGEPVTSCVVEPLSPDATSPKPRLPAAGTNQRIAWDVLGPVFRAAGIARPEGVPQGVPPGRPVVTMEAALDAIGPRLVVPEKRRRERATQALQGLCGRGLLCHEEGWLWCA
jgi:KaiC/GvpD/RAD55 family RecA-like ATPase